MRDETWVQGMKELAATFPDRDLPEAVLATRGAVYRRELGGLSDDAWLFAVREAIRNDRWFPTVAALLEYAESAGAPRVSVAGLLEEPVFTREERDAAARAGLELIRQELMARGINVGPPVRDMPDPEREARLAELRAQARQIVEDEVVTPTLGDA